MSGPRPNNPRGQNSNDQFVKDISEFISKLGGGGGGRHKKSGPHRPGASRGRGGGGKEFTPDSSLKFMLGLIAALFGAISLIQSFYMVDVSEQGVVTRFGRYHRTVDPGLHFKIPFGLENVSRVKTEVVHQEEFGFRTQSSRSQRRSYSKDTLNAESLMLTGDLNVADVEWILQYRIDDAKKYLYIARNVETNIRDVSISIMRRVVGDKLVNDVLTTGREEIADEAKVLTQKVLDDYDMGIRVVRINLQDVNPPDPVKGAFNEVNAAKQEQEQTINQAEQEYNKRIPEARGRAEQTVRDAEAFSVNLVNRSRGDAQRFERMYREYVKAPDITKKRIYLETMREVLGDHEGLTVVDEDLKGILPIYGGLSGGALKSTSSPPGVNSPAATAAISGGASGPSQLQDSRRGR